MEQGFTIPARPASAGEGALKLSLAVSGNVHGVATSGGVTFSGQGASLAYGGLVATDARGRRLPARMRLQGGRLVLAVDAQGAHYPVRVDPLLQQAKLTASDGALGVLVGWTVAVSANGSTIAVGAPLTQDSVGSGAVYVFTRPPAGWASEHEVAKLTPSDDGLGVGFSVAISADGSTIVAGAPTTSGANLEQGAAYVFTRPPGGWTSEHQAAQLTASDGGIADMLGLSVAISGGMIVAGAPGAMVAGNEDQGAAYVSVEPPGGWANAHETAKLTASGGGAEDALGQSVAISGDTVVTGSPEGIFGFKSGQAYVFVKPAGGWVSEQQTATLTASDAFTTGEFGASVATSADGSTVVAGSPGVNAVYVFDQPPGGWASEHEAAKLTGSDVDNTAFVAFGLSVAISPDGSAIVAGAPAVTVGGNELAGAYVFSRPRGGWISEHEAAKLTAAAGATDDEFGASVAIAGGTIVAGAPTTQTGAGQAYVFGPGPTSTSVGCSSSAVAVGQPFRCTATVTDTALGPTTPTGSVSFGSGGSCALAGSSASASCSVSFTSAAAGTKTVTAGYGGDLEHAASRGSASKVVSKAGTSIGVVSSKNPSVRGGNVTFTATVGALAPGAGTPTGMVTFLAGASQIGVAPLVAGRASVTSSKLAVGRQRITAQYGGDQNFEASSATLGQSVTATGGFTVSQIRAHRDGMISFAVNVPGSGAIDVLETAWKDNSARTAVPIQPARRRFVYARARKTAQRATTVRFRVKPNRRGRKLVRHHRYRVILRLWVSYTPTGGEFRKQGFYGLRLPKSK